MNIDLLLYMLEGDTTVMRGMLLENNRVRQGLADALAGRIKYDDLLELTYMEF